MGASRTVIVGAGVAGLAAAVDLAARGVEVIVLERADAPGGKMREIAIGEARIDAGPTVLTLRPAEILARHAWTDGGQLDLYGDVERSADAIGVFAGRDEAQRYRAFCARSQAIYETLEQPFLRASRPTPIDLVRGVGVRGLADLWRIQPFATLWRALGEHFHDPRLRQLFGRYATYVGSSPFLAPATLMLIAHVEREGVWLVEGGMHRLAVALERLAVRHGAVFRYAAEARDLALERGRVRGVVLASGERLEADAVLCNADVAGVASGLLGSAAARAVPRTSRSQRSLSAVTWALVAKTEGFPLLRHSVFFSRDYAAEFDDLLRHRRLPAEPTVYVCAQDRGAVDGEPPSGGERLLCLVNAPPSGDSHPFERAEIERCEERAFGLLSRCGLQVQRTAAANVVTTPAAFERLFPGTGGALYGPVSHGWRASFRRPGPRTTLRGLYLAGGSTHPGAGVPMAAMAGRLAAAAIVADSASTHGSRPVATSGGTSMR